MRMPTEKEGVLLEFGVLMRERRDTVKLCSLYHGWKQLEQPVIG